MHSWGWPPALNLAPAIPTPQASTPSFPLVAEPTYSLPNQACGKASIAHTDMWMERETEAPG